MLPLWRQVVFVDWHGVLSNDRFWKSILTSVRHPLRAQLEAKLETIFINDQRISHEWMKGLRSSSEVISSMQIRLPPQFKHEYFHSRLIEDWSNMTVNVDLFHVINYYQSRAFIVIATDNMDCAIKAFEHLRKRDPRHKRNDSDTFAAWADWCDDIVCSSNVGKLKSEDPKMFFEPWLMAHGLGFEDALLIDDRAANCEAFVRAGVTAIQWRMGSSQLSELTQSL